MDIIQKIKTSALTEREKEVALNYINKYKHTKNLRYYDFYESNDENDFFDYGHPVYKVAAGTVELILAILNKPDIGFIKNLRNISSDMAGHWGCGGPIDPSFYEGLHQSSNGEFNVRSFSIMLDGDYDNDFPYAGYLQFEYNGESFYYAPHYDKFHMDILRFINYFLLKYTNTNKRFCIVGFGMQLSGSSFAPALFIEQAEYEMLIKNLWMSDYDFNAENNDHFWVEPNELPQFISYKKGMNGVV